MEGIELMRLKCRVETELLMLQMSHLNSILENLPRTADADRIIRTSEHMTHLRDVCRKIMDQATSITKAVVDGAKATVTIADKYRLNVFPMPAHLLESNASVANQQGRGFVSIADIPPPPAHVVRGIYES